MPPTISSSVSFDALVDDFLNRFRRGEHPTIEDYRDRHPLFAQEIEHYFPALMVIEEFGSRPRQDKSTAQFTTIPNQFGDYTLVREIGRGGMGIVYEAVQESLGRKVALKVLPESYRLKGSALARFRREASTAARLHHTNIVPVFDYGEWHGIPYYAMQHIDGQGLDFVISDFRRVYGKSAPEHGQESGHSALLPTTVYLLDQANVETVRAIQSSSTKSELLSKGYQSKTNYYRYIASLGVQAAEALAHAHANGILHRDIKPSNILLDIHGTLWIADFGLAKGGDTEDVTKTGELIGTLRYMAPERFRGETTKQSDVYSLGVTLYELLALEPAFQDKDQPKLIASILNKTPVHLRLIDPQIPADLETIVDKAISSDPKDRYDSAGTLADDLRRFLQDRPILARKSNSSERLMRWCRRNRSLASMVALTLFSLVAVTVGSIYSAFTFQQQLKQVQQAQREEKAKLFEAKVEKTRALVWSRRVGQHYESLQTIHEAMDIARDLPLSHAAKLDLRNLALAALILPDVEQIQMPQALPAGIKGSDIVCNHDLAWYLAIDNHGKLSQYRTSDSGMMHSFSGIDHVQQVYLSPDDRYVLVQALDFQGVSKLVLCDLQNHAMTPMILSAAKALRGSPFSEDSHFLLLLGSDGFLQMRDTSSGKLVKQLKQQANLGSWVAQQPVTGYWAILSPEGAYSQLIDISADRTHREWDTRVQGKIGGLIWNNNGSMLVMEIGSCLYVWDTRQLETRLISQLEKQQNEPVRASFIAESDLLISSCWDGTCQLWDPVAGQSLLRLPGTLLGVQHVGDQILLRDQVANVCLWRLNAGSMCRTLHHGLVGNRTEKPGWVHNADFSPDGRVLATTGEDVRFWNVEKGIEVGSLELGGCCGTFQPGTWHYFTSSVHGIQRWPVVPFDSSRTPQLRISQPTKLSSGTTDYEAFPRWSPDGHYLSWVEGENAVLWDPMLAGKVHLFDALPHLRYIALSPHAELVARGPHRGGSWIEVRERASSRVVFQYACEHLGYPCFSPDGCWLYTETIEEGIRRQHLWKTADWQQGPILEETPRTAGVCFSPDSCILARGIAPGIVKLLDVTTGTEIAQLNTLSDTHHYSITFAPQGDYLAVANMDHSFQVWNIRALRRELAVLGLDW